MSFLEELNDKFEAQYSRKENSQIIGEYKRGNPMEGMDISVEDDSPVYAEYLARAKWVADHPAKVGYHKRFISCWVSLVTILFVLCIVFNSPFMLSVVGLALATPCIIVVFNTRAHIINRLLGVIGAVLSNYLTVAGFFNDIEPSSIITDGFMTFDMLLRHIFGSFYTFFMFSLILTAAMIFAVKLFYPIIKRLYCNVPVEAVIVSYDKFRHFGIDRFSPVYLYIYQGKKYLKISPNYSYKEEGFLGACGNVIVNPDQPKDAVLPEETLKFEYIIGGILSGIFAVMFLAFLLPKLM